MASNLFTGVFQQALSSPFFLMGRIIQKASGIPVRAGVYLLKKMNSGAD